ncbi:MAG: US12 family protein [Verrucomicrobiae bacterium]|nr:US12 family protein [Verrucomicrobiae bacterium]
MSLHASYQNPYVVAAQAPVDARAMFIRKTYAHLAGAIAAFALLEAMIMSIPGIEDKVFGLLGASRYSWLVVLGLFMGASWLADNWARSEASRGMQYAGLGLFVAAEAVVFLPLLLIARRMTGDASLISQAGLITGALFLGLTFVALTTRKDFSFLGGFLKIGGIIALGMIVASIFFQGFTLGIWFSGAMVLLAAGSVLYTTGNMIHHYRTDQYVAASLGLFSAVALMFWYILRILMSLRR